MKEKKFRTLNFFLFLFSLTVFLLIINVFISLLMIKNIQFNLSNYEYSKLKNNLFVFEVSNNLNSTFFKIISLPIKYFAFTNEIEKLNEIFAIGNLSVNSLNKILHSLDSGSFISKKFFSKENRITLEEINNVQENLGTAYNDFIKIQSKLDRFTGTEPIIGRYLGETKKNLASTRAFLIQSKQLADILPILVGENGKKSYLFLFQNNMELRPTGGFIGSYGVLTIEKGKLIDFEIQDVYFADGQLKGHVDPPEVLGKYLGLDGWYLRDSNWDPDFPTSARRAAWFLEKETGRNVNGVIAVNLFVAQRFLKILKEINLPDYQEKIDDKNFFERAQYHAEVGFFPGSRAKRDFLGAVSNALWERLRLTTEEESIQIFLSLVRSIEEKDVLIFFDDEKSQSLMSKFNWDGGIKKPKCNLKNGECYEDYLMLAEANVGVNKANYYLERNLFIDTKILETGQVEKKITIVYKNNSPSEIFPAGRYRNYLRIYLPVESEILSCQIDKELCSIDETFEQKRKVFGLLVDVPVGSETKVEFTYKLNKLFSEGRYLMFIQKQSGTKNDPLESSFFFPKSLKFASSNFGMLTREGLLFYNTILEQDKILEFDFQKTN